ncbi:MAG: CPBP family intramembrane metalloprotease [Treponema sp.]|nr:CPBP family intramembrane metalloprotease [Treponema sp.]
MNLQVTKRGWIFLALEFAVAWGLAGVVRAAGLRPGTPVFLAFLTFFMVTPLITALILSTVRPSGTPLKDVLGLRFRMGWKGFFLAWLLFPALAFLTLGISLLMPGVRYDPSMSQLIERLTQGMSPERIAEIRETAGSAPPLLLALVQGLAAGISINALFGFGEEAGWRGFLVKELKGSSFWAASVFTGAVWGLWHAPIILQGHNYPEHRVLGVFLMILYCVLLSPVYLYIRLKTKSAVAAAVAHGSMNATAGLSIMPLAGGTDLTVGMTGLAGFVSAAGLLAALYALDRRSKTPILSSTLGADE